MASLQKSALLFASAIGFFPLAASTPAPASNPSAVTVRQVISMQALAGQTVIVSGRCLAKGSPAVAPGSRPYSSVWQLEDNGAATWVLGPMPASCSNGSAIITGRVVQDTLPKFSSPRSLRQYLDVR
jgi:hypothetical protein